jgi:hypothetical protein
MGKWGMEIICIHECGWIQLVDDVMFCDYVYDGGSTSNLLCCIVMVFWIYS